MDYLINKYKGRIDLKKAICECCSVVYETNINRTRCSKGCATIMKNRRHRTNKVIQNLLDE